MEDNFNHDDFEEFLQDQVRNQRMYPSDAVWREIDKKLHGEKRWPALTIAASAILSATILICLYFTPKPNIFEIKSVNANNSTPVNSSKNNILSGLNTTIPFSKVQNKPLVIEGPSLTNSVQHIVNANSVEGSTKTPTTKSIDLKAIDIASTTLSNSYHTQTEANSTTQTSKLEPAGEVIQPGIAKVVQSNLNKKTDDEDAASINLQKQVDDTIKITTSATSSNNLLANNTTDRYSKPSGNELGKALFNRTISNKNRFSYQLYFAPSISYRKLLEDQAPVQPNNGGPIGLNYVTDVNKVVRHKPGTGIEAGFNLMYNLTGKVRVKSGFQFNVRQYSIEAYRSSMELASIALTGRNGMDTINTLSTYRNNNGYYSAELVNKYYQISIPIGLEWEVIGNKTLQLNVAGTIQPTYLLNRNAYLLSSNFKNYTENPGIVRQWNLNSNIEAFITYKVGDFKWQLGPQVRYQPYSTFIPQYSIKEHLLDYGIKLGFSHALN